MSLNSYCRRHRHLSGMYIVPTRTVWFSVSSLHTQLLFSVSFNSRHRHMLISRDRSIVPSTSRPATDFLTSRSWWVVGWLIRTYQLRRLFVSLRYRYYHDWYITHWGFWHPQLGWKVQRLPLACNEWTITTFPTINALHPLLWVILISILQLISPASVKMGLA